jgi:hypothetical protein
MTTSANEEQKLRKALAGSTGGMTYHSRSLADLQLEQGHSGRFTEKASVTGAERVPNVPRMPEGNPWHSDLVPPEGPLGYEINAQESVGEPFELAASFAILLDDVAEAREADPRCAAPTADLVSRAVGASLSQSRRAWSPGGLEGSTNSGDAGVDPSSTSFSLLRGRRL